MGFLVVLLSHLWSKDGLQNVHDKNQHLIILDCPQKYLNDYSDLNRG
jgi:hypothetical protein